MKLFVKFPVVSLVVLCGFAQAQYESADADEAVREQSPEIVKLPGAISEGGMIVDVRDDKIIFYQPASEDGKKKETYGTIEIDGEGRQSDLDIKMDEYENGQVKAQHKKIKVDETNGKFDVKFNNVVDGKEQELKRGYFDAQSNEFVTESCTGLTTSSGDCVVQEETLEKPNFQRSPAAAGEEKRLQLDFESGSFPNQ